MPLIISPEFPMVLLQKHVAYAWTDRHIYICDIYRQIMLGRYLFGETGNLTITVIIVLYIYTNVNIHIIIILFRG
jgi:hypothetical protein